MHDEVASIFHQLKLYRKSTSEWHGSFAHWNYNARWNDVKIRRYWPVDIDATCWVCWYNIRTKLVLVSTQSHRCFSIRFWRCFSIDEMMTFRRWNADLFNVNMKIITSWASQYIKTKIFQNKPKISVVSTSNFDSDLMLINWHCFEVQIRLSFQH